MDQERLINNIAKLVCILAEREASRLYTSYANDLTRGGQFEHSSKKYKEAYKLLRNLIKRTEELIGESDDRILFRKLDV